MTAQSIVALSFLVPGLILFAAWATLAARRRAFRRKATRFSGVVTAHASRHGMHDGMRTTTTAPVVTYTDELGKARVFQQASASSHPPAIGTHTDVLQLPGDPTSARMANPPLAWVVPVVLLSSSWTFLLVSVLVWVFA